MSADAGFVVTAAGASVRMGGARKKEYRLLDGLPVLLHSIQAAFQTGLFDRYVVVLPPGDEAVWYDELLPLLDSPCRDLVTLAPGGTSRQESVFHALEALSGEPPEIVLIHDGARPWVSPALIGRVYRKAREKGACIPVVALVDAPKRIGPTGEVVEHLDKHHLVGAQTPQGFRFSLIYEAHRRFHDRLHLFPDDAALCHAAGIPVHTVEGDPVNRKITFPWDLP
ncbi:IspD/TarI family cytidylyltransferase [Spirochaeta thermophila]|uniref:2-C-methyl-D-erythritol 4-phosphate cytidylyltransferase n=1 Tax=Winmispira thermophila (strain ATCC 49972 / DSM 6192 / RI 19.B1) TaxID=665571 RepID=E0RPY0_WINT6|nr:IspD/TarI family cytidylyltransferase [Spirochaeta thermophila]ADN02833.1 2-C-methyl-D-erythritol 4-phosphate cytidylyltransferase [Spirochaeta thermophila DSM 6192]